MSQDLDTGYEEFMEGFGEEVGNQTEDEPAPEETTDTGTGESPEETESQQEEVASEEPTEPEKKEGEEPSTPSPATTETFTLKVNKEERICSREEVIELAQKGADYDRIRTKLNEQSEAMEVLTALAKEAGTDIPGLLDNFRLSMLKKQGLSEDAATERLAREKVERENAALRASQKQGDTGAERMQRELAEFRAAYPKVELTDELVKKLSADIQSGVSMLDAYRRMETAQKDARIAQLERELEAQKQNRRNAAASPGSMKDSGGRRSQDDLKAFNDALFG